MSNIVLKKNPLFDQEFLNELFGLNQKEIYAKIILLNIREEPIEQIEGKIIDGSINVDGASAVRRTCSLSMIAEDVNIHEFYWGIKSKFKLEVGLKNEINPLYPDVIWFKQGVFVITQFNTSQSLNKWEIKIQGKDKMCLLNGELSGQLPLTDFAVEQYTDTTTGEITFKELPIKTIIRKIMQEFALELPHNIIINDIDESGQELLEYQGLEPLYLFKNIDTGTFENMSINNNLECYYQMRTILNQQEYDLIPDDYDYLRMYYVKNEKGLYEFNEIAAYQDDNFKKRVKENNWVQGRLSDEFNIIYDDCLDDIEFQGGKLATPIKFAKNNVLSEDSYTLIRIQAGDSPGYRITDLTFAGELKSSVGETITSILDKIKNQFVHFEYYYDIDGKFVFQKKKEYLTIPWNSIERSEEKSLDASINDTQVLFNFIDNKLLISLNNSPNITEVKNDYSVYGHRNNIPIHMRYAIDNKPTEYLPIRPLKEKIVSIYRNAEQQIIRTDVEEKFYDAPEVEPYNSIGLIGIDTSYKILEFLDFRVNAYDASNEDYIFGNIEFREFKESIDPEIVGQDFYDKWFSLFRFDNRLQYIWTGTVDDIKEMIFTLNENETKYGNNIQMSIIPTEDGGEIWRIIYPYYAKYPYSIQHIVLDESHNICYKDEIEDTDIVVHYKVDWRELIYQMSLDYRKLNFTDDYTYYLTQANPQFIYGRTNYEQYYIDMSLWRDLYNPNPKVIYSDNVKYSDIKRQSLLTDKSQDNDDLDMFYIKGGYRLIKPEDKDNLSYTDVFQYDQPQDSIVSSIYPFYLSSTGCLQEEKIKYYIENNLSKVMENMYNVTEEGITLTQTQYDTLAELPAAKIFIKNDKRLDTKAFRVNEVTITKENYQPHMYYIKEDDKYILSSRYEEGRKYYSFNTTSEYETSTIESKNQEFRVLSYPSITNLSSEYEQNATADYIVYAENKFNDENIQKLIFGDKDDPTYNNTEYFIKDDSYIKLSEIKKNEKLYNLYYRSILFTIAFKTSAIIDQLDNYIKLSEQYKSEPIKYLNKILEVLKEYIIYLESFDCDDLKNTLYNNLYDLIMLYKEALLEISIMNRQEKDENSCLSYICTTLKDSLDNMNFDINDTSSSNEKLLNLIIQLNHLNLIAQTALNGLALNYNQVKSINTTDSFLKILKEEQIPEEPANQILQIEDLISHLQGFLNDLSRIKNTYKEGQLNKTKAMISVLLDDALIQQETINKIKDETEKNRLNLELLNKLRNDSKKIIQIVDLLQMKLNSFYDNTLYQIIWTPNLEVLEEQKELGNITYEDPYIYVKEQHQLYQLLFKIKNLITIILDIDNNNNILSMSKEALSFNGQSLFKDLYEKLTLAKNNEEARTLIRDFIEFTSDFQESIILEDVNNFNKIDGSNKIFYYPIQYYKATYAYNHEPNSGNFWTLDIHNAPSLLTFWFDFLEPTSEEMLKYSVPVIGTRSKVINDTLISAIHHKEVPTIIFKDMSKNDYTELSGYTYINLTKAFMNLFKVSSKGKTAKNRIEELLTNHSYCTENINISTTPVYNLEPNYKVYLRDSHCNINGEYTITKISIPLNYKKMMSITATKAVSNIV